MEVVIVANTPASGKVFDKWVSDSGSFASAISTSTVFTMPAGAATVTATYKDAPASTYTLTVIEGSGSGNYEEGMEVVIVANTPASGKLFDKWTSNSGSFANATSASTTFTMPTSAATVTATYKDAPTSTYTLTVIGGTGSGNYTAGTEVAIVANTPASGKLFDKWTSNSGSFADATSASTTFTMPAGAATVTATYMNDIPDGTEEVSNSGLSVWSAEKSLYIKSVKDGTAYIYTISGRLAKAAPYHAGENTIALPAGIYLVRAGDETFKVYIK
jgi:head-tail adaptor